MKTLQKIFAVIKVLFDNNKLLFELWNQIKAEWELIDNAEIRKEVNTMEEEAKAAVVASGEALDEETETKKVA